MITLRFELRYPTRAGSYQHLALFGLHTRPNDPPQAHWMLPYECSQFPELEHALLLTESDASALPGQVLDAGPAGLSTTIFPIERSICQLNLQLYGQHICGQFDLQRLQPGGSVWLLAPVAGAAPSPRNPTQAGSPMHCTYAR